MRVKFDPRDEVVTHARTYTHAHTCTHGTYGVLHCLLFCDQTRPNLRISLVGYHCAIEFPCGVLLFYCCKYPTTYGVRVHTARIPGCVYDRLLVCTDTSSNISKFRSIMVQLRGHSLTEWYLASCLLLPMQNTISFKPKL